MKRIISSAVLLVWILVLFCGCFAPVAPYLGNVVVIGDSYSTFKGHVPEGYPSWYSPTASYTNVTNVQDTWWHRLIATTDSHLVLNSSYSGGTVCHTGYQGEDFSDFSFVTRVTHLAENGFFRDNQVNTLIVYGGLNDYWAGAPLGEIKFFDITDDDLYHVFPATSKLIATAQEYAPKMRILFIIGHNLGSEMKAGFQEICDHYDVETVALSEIDLHNSHPTKIGMQQITQTIINHLLYA